MAAQIGSLIVTLTADIGQYGTAMGRAEQVTTRSTDKIRRTLGLTQKSVDAVNKTMGSGFRPFGLLAASRAFENAADRAALLRASTLAAVTAFGGFTAAITGNVLLRYADSYTSLNNQIRTVSTNSADLAAQFKAVNIAADDSRAALQGTAQLYARLQKAVPTQSVDNAVRLVSTIQKGLQLGGATTQEAASAALQLSQGIASNQLGGEELRALRETPLGAFLAKGLGVPIGDLKELGAQGKLTADVVIKAFEKVAPEIEAAFAKSVMTVDQAFTVADNRLTAYIGSTNEAYGITKLLASGIMTLSSNFGTLLPIVTAIAGALGANFLGANAGRGISGAIQSVRDRAKEAREEMEKFRSAQERIQQALGQARSDVTGISNAAANPMGSAPRSEQAAYERASEKLRKLDEERLKILNNQGLAYKLLASATEQQRAVLAEAVNEQTRQLNVLDQARQKQVDLVRAAGDVATKSGMSILAKQAADAGVRVTFLEERLGAVSEKLGDATKAATRTGVALGVLRSAGSSLFAFLGGPWGVALTAATIALGIFGAEAAKSAAEVARAEDLIAERLRRQAQAQGQNSSAQTRVTQMRVDALNKEIETIQRYTDAKKAELNANTFSPRTAQGREMIQLQEQITRVTTLFAQGRLSVDSFNKQLDDIAASNPAVQSLVDKARQIGPVMRDGAAAVADIHNEIKGLLSTVNGSNFRASEIASMTKLAAAQAAGQAGTMADLKTQVFLSGLRAKGLNAEAAAHEAVAKAAAAGEVISYQQALAQTKAIEANNKAASSLKSAEKAAETYQQRIARLKEELQGAWLSDLDREVLAQARSLKVAADEMDRYTKAAQSGNFSGVNPQLMEIRGLLQQREAAEAARDLVKQYGDLNQIAPQLAQYQEQLNIAVQQGAITTQQAATAYGQYLSSFGQYQWIGDLSQAFGQFAESAVLDFENIGDAVDNLTKRILQLILQMAVIGPLQQMLMGGIGGLFGGGGAPVSLIGGNGPMAVPTFMHSGGTVGAGNRGKAMPASLFASAPRFHKGGGYFGPGEVPAVLKRGEGVFTPQQMSSMGGGGNNTQVNVFSEGKVETKKRRQGGVDIVDVMVGENGKALAEGKYDAAMRGRYDGAPKTVPR